MSTTYTVGREVFAMRTERGTALYLLTEKTYESNVSPQTPHWSSIYFGEAPGAVARIVGRAAACEGGMLATPSRRSTPESYIASWLKHLTKPRVLPISEISIRAVDSDRWLNANEIKREHRDGIVEILAKKGLAEKANDLQDHDKCTLSLASHGEVIVAILAEAQMSPWRLLIAPMSSYDDADPSLAIGKTPAKHANETYPHALRIPDDSMILLQDDDGNWRAGSSAYNLVSQYVQTLGASSTIPANFKNLIGTYRDHIKNAPVADGASLKARIDTTVTLSSKYDEDRFAELRAFGDAVNDEGIITVPYSRERAFALTRMPREATTWIVSHDPATYVDTPMALFATG